MGEIPGASLLPRRIHRRAAQGGASHAHAIAVHPDAGAHARSRRAERGDDAARACGPSELEIKTNAFTANRVTSLRTGIEKIRERPLTGHGLKQITVRYEAFGKVRFAEIHNLWIKWAAYTGIFGPIMMAVVAVAILRIGVKNLSVTWRLARDRMSAAALCLILIVGAVSTMFEPNVLVGSFQLTALWWAAAGCALGMWAEANEDGGADFESDGGE